MIKLRRLYHIYRKQIWAVVLIVVIVLMGIKTLESFYQSKNDKEIQNQVEITPSAREQGEEESNKKVAILSSTNVSENEYNIANTVINEFFRNCNEGKITDAYNLLSIECKANIFTTEDYFKFAYIDKVFPTTKDHSIQAWIGKTYKVKIFDDLLSTGTTLDKSAIVEDYYTVVEEGGQSKLNINSFVGTEDVNKKMETNDVVITVNKRIIYMDYEYYDIQVENKLDRTIALDSKEKTTNIYLVDSNDIQCLAFLHEIDQTGLILNKRATKNLKIKFNNSYRTNVEIHSMVFNDVILDYQKYLDTEDKTKYTDRTNIKINF